MQTPLIDKRTAAETLGRGCRSVELYAKRGMLARVRRGHRVYFLRDEVEGLREELDQGSPSASNTEILLRLKRLEANVEFLLMLQDAKRSSLLTEQELLELLPNAQAGLKKEHWSVEDLLKWCQIYTRLTDEDLYVLHGELVKRGRRGSHAWLIPYKLCVTQVAYIRKHPRFGSMLDLQRAHALLLKARNIMRDRILLEFGDELLDVADAYEKKFGARPRLRDELMASILAG